MAQLLLALETGNEPAISGRDNLKTMALVEAAYRSVDQFRAVAVEEITGIKATKKIEAKLEKKSPGILGTLISTFIQKCQPETDRSDFIGCSSFGFQNNFTPRAQQVIVLARKEADHYNHHFVDTEHLLLGLLKLGQGTAVNLLLKQGLNLKRVRLEVENQVGTVLDQKVTGNIPYTPRLITVLCLAVKEARALKYAYVGTEHILLGLLKENDGVAARVLENLDVDIEQTRLEILKELDPNFGGEE